MRLPFPLLRSVEGASSATIVSWGPFPPGSTVRTLGCFLRSIGMDSDAMDFILTATSSEADSHGEVDAGRLLYRRHGTATGNPLLPMGASIGTSTPSFVPLGWVATFEERYLSLELDPSGAFADYYGWVSLDVELPVGLPEELSVD